MSSRPFAQRRDVDADDVQPVEEVLAELARCHGLLERLVGGGDDAHIHLDGLVAADALERAGLQHAQDLGLRGGGHVADLVEEERAAVALLEFADALEGGAGEGAAFVAEQFAFEQLLGDGGAVDGQERLFGCGGCGGRWRARPVPCPCRFRR